MVPIKNVAVVGHTYSQAMELIRMIEKEKDLLNLIPETIGNTDHLPFITSQVGIDGKVIKIFPLEQIDIFLKYENLVVVDFTEEQQNLLFYKEKNINKIRPRDGVNTKDILELIILK
jgi:hypothetical protein